MTESEHCRSMSMNGTPILLLVEPSPILRSSLHDWLDQALRGHRILTAANGLEALRVCGQERPSHILIEMELPDMPGWEVIEQMRQALPDARIVATGWYASRVLLHRVWIAGASGFIRKHKLPSELLPLWEITLK
jgi:DNA-binding NarL/FixJ family response regulator